MSSLANVYGFQSVSVDNALQKAVGARKRVLNLSSSDSHLPSGERHSNTNQGRRIAEFVNLEPVEESQARKARRERDIETKAQFAKYGDELWGMRQKMKRLKETLGGALSGSGTANADAIRQELREVELRDPELVYGMELLEMELAQRDGNKRKAVKALERALDARSCLPQYNLEGLWVGKYGSHGYEMINVTYVGDTLIAFKVTGDKNVPRGEITFQADLTPTAVRQFRGGRRKAEEAEEKPLEPIVLTEKAASKWGTRQLPRYRGLGQVAETDFTNKKWMDGQLIIIGEDYFSFAWVPLENQIFFGRPSPELSLKMLREGGMDPLRRKTHWEAPPSLDDDVDVLKNYVFSCLEKTAETLEDEMPAGDQFSCIWSGGADTEECFFQ